MSFFRFAEFQQNDPKAKRGTTFHLYNKKIVPQMRDSRGDFLRSRVRTDSMPQWFVYILKCADGSFYTGITTDVQKRLLRHNSGKGAAYTRSHSPVELAWFEEVKSHSDALLKEAAIKKLDREKKKQLITKNNFDFPQRGPVV